MTGILILLTEKRIILTLNGGTGQTVTRVSPELQPTRVATSGEYELARGVEKGRGGSRGRRSIRLRRGTFI